MKKTVLSTILGLAIVISMVACGNAGTPSTTLGDTIVMKTSLSTE